MYVPLAHVLGTRKYFGRVIMPEELRWFNPTLAREGFLVVQGMPWRTSQNGLQALQGRNLAEDGENVLGDAVGFLPAVGEARGRCPESSPSPHNAPLPVDAADRCPPASLGRQMDTGQWEVHVYSPSSLFPPFFSFSKERSLSH